MKILYLFVDASWVIVMMQGHGWLRMDERLPSLSLISCKSPLSGVSVEYRRDYRSSFSASETACSRRSPFSPTHSAGSNTLSRESEHFPASTRSGVVCQRSRTSTSSPAAATTAATGSVPVVGAHAQHTDAPPHPHSTRVSHFQVRSGDLEGRHSPAIPRVQEQRQPCRRTNE